MSYCLLCGKITKYPVVARGRGEDERCLKERLGLSFMIWSKRAGVLWFHVFCRSTFLSPWGLFWWREKIISLNWREGLTRSYSFMFWLNTYFLYLPFYPVGGGGGWLVWVFLFGWLLVCWLFFFYQSIYIYSFSTFCKHLNLLEGYRNQT